MQETPPSRRFSGGLKVQLAVLALAVVVAFVFLLRREAPAPPAPSPRPAPNLAVVDDGAYHRGSTEERFLDYAAHQKPASSLPLDESKIAEESGLILKRLRDLFVRMKALADRYRKSDPARYAHEMELLKDELISLLDASRRLLGKEASDETLLALLLGESDPVVKERLAFLLRYVGRERSKAAVVELAASSLEGDRKIAIMNLHLLGGLDSARRLSDLARSEIVMDLRQRAIMELGKFGMDPGLEGGKEAHALALETIRELVKPGHPREVRAAAYRAFSQVNRLERSDLTMIQSALHSEKDPLVKNEVNRTHYIISTRRKKEGFGASK